jgi:acetolactate synthase-1/2/3 large subunit
MKLSGAEITIKLLEQFGIDTISGIPGGANLPLYSALANSSIRHILARHEQGAGFIAQGMARTTGKTAVCMATSGPGVTNLITAIADAKLDSVPLIAITGQIAYNMVGSDAFQEIDTYGLTLGITKHNFLVRSAAELLSVIPEAFYIAESGRPGPVLIDIPKDVQKEMIEINHWPIKRTVVNDMKIERNTIVQAIEMIKASERPVLYVGGGIVSGDASEILKEFAEKQHIPVASTLMGLGVFPADNPLSLGIMGMHGAKYTNLAFYESDLIIAAGVRFDDRAVGNANEFCKGAKIIHIDIDPSEINKVKQATLCVEGDAKDALNQITMVIGERDRSDWLERVAELKTAHPLYEGIAGMPYHPVNFIKQVAAVADRDAIICTDVGQHQMWVAQNYPILKPRTLLTSGGLGTMGFGLPAAIGAALANPDRQIILFTGDGSILMNLQELATMRDFDLNIKIIILNNGHLGLVRQLQELFYDKTFIATEFISNPDFTLIAKGFGIESFDFVSGQSETEQLKTALSSKGGCVINVPTEIGELVLPIVTPGKGNHIMIGA